jgi:hypothetical protein
LTVDEDEGDPDSWLVGASGSNCFRFLSDMVVECECECV